MNRLALLASVIASCLALAACSSSVESTADGGHGGQGGGSTAGSISCSPTKACPADSFCHYADHGCGTVSPTGTCQLLEHADCSPPELACGCDGAIAMTCTDSVGSVDIALPSMCAKPAGKMECGLAFCDVATEYCYGTNPDGCGEVYACAPLPTACVATPTCDCVTANDGVWDCSGDATTGMTGLGPSGDSPQCP